MEQVIVPSLPGLSLLENLLHAEAHRLDDRDQGNVVVGGLR